MTEKNEQKFFEGKDRADFYHYPGEETDTVDLDHVSKVTTAVYDTIVNELKALNPDVDTSNLSPCPGCVGLTLYNTFMLFCRKHDEQWGSDVEAETALALSQQLEAFAARAKISGLLEKMQSGRATVTGISGEGSLNELLNALRSGAEVSIHVENVNPLELVEPQGQA